MKIKVCGLTDGVNASEIEACGIDYLGFIFYSGSPRGITMDSSVIEVRSAAKVGVFVNEPEQRMLSTTRKHGISAVQLHGKESPEQCARLQNEGYEVIKAFPVDDRFDFRQTDPYASVVDYFLFDTRTSGYGGSGKKFNWNKLNEFNQEVPFFLSGGIAPSDVNVIPEIAHLNVHALDLNSRFEIRPGIKNIDAVQSFVHQLKSYR